MIRKMTLERLLKLIRVAGVLTIPLCSPYSMAAFNCNFNGTGVETFNFPSPISVPRDNTSALVPLSGWVMGAATQNTYTCTASNNTQVGIGLKFPTFSQAGSYSENGITYKVLQTATPGVGIIYGLRYYTTGPGCEGAIDGSAGMQGWYPWVAASGTIPYSNRYCYTSGTGDYTFGMQVQARLIKTGKIAAGMLQGFTLTNTALQVDGAFSTGTGSTNYNIGPVQFQALGCSAEGGNITLPTINKSVFASATSVQTTPFQFVLRNCPAGMNAIQYQLDSIMPVISATDGTFQNATGADMAKGVGLRITNETNTAPIRLGDSSYVVSDYSPAAGNSSLPIKLNVSYFRTGTAAQVLGGKVSGTAQLTVFYL